jgi:hypothetical protein
VHGETVDSVVLRSFQWSEEVECMVPGYKKEDPSSTIGDVVESRGYPLLKYLEKLKIVTKVLMTELVSRQLVGDVEFVNRLLGRYPAMYIYTTVDSLPPWSYVLM